MNSKLSLYIIRKYMQGQSYQDFLKLSADKQYDLVQQKKQS